MVLDCMLHIEHNRNRGITWIIVKRLEELDFMLTYLFLRKDFRIFDLNIEAEKIGLKINTQKTKEMLINHHNYKLEMDGAEIECIKQICYLGNMVNQDGGADADMESRINKTKCLRTDKINVETQPNSQKNEA